METFKIIYLDIGLRRPLKCGRSQGAWSYEVAQEQINAQKQENALDRDWNTSEAEKARDFQYDELMMQQEFQNAQRLASQEYQSDEWQRQFDVQNEYNTPTAQASRLRSAGINPQIAMGGDAAKVVTGSSVSAPSGSAPSVPSPAAAQGVHGLSSVPFHPGTNLAQDLSQLAQATKSFGDAYKAGVEGDYLAAAMPSMLRIQMGTAAKVELENAYLDTANALQRVKLPYAQQREIKELAKLEAEAYESASKGKNYEGETRLQDKRGEVYTSLANLNDTNAQVAGIKAQHLGEVMDAQRDQMRAAANEHNAQAGLASARAQTENEIREHMVKLEQFKGDMLGLDKYIRDHTLGAEWSARLAQLHRDKVINDKELAEGKLAIERVEQTVKARNESEAWKALDNLQHYLRHDMNYSAPNVGLFMNP